MPRSAAIGKDRVRRAHDEVLASAVVFATILSAPAYAKAATPGLKSAGACSDEYKANKGALKDAKEKKKDFIAACRALAPGTPTPIGAAATTPPAPVAPSAPVPQQAAAPRTAPAPVAPTSRAPAPVTTTAPSGANQFAAETAAKARCPSATVVWVNTKSGIYHFAGTKNYGNTKAGAYMCEADATAAGHRASKTEKHP